MTTPMTTMPPDAGLAVAPARPVALADRLAVLVVDDSPLDRKIVDRILTDLGTYTIRIATNGVEALAALAREIPRVVLTDMQMPVMDGLTLVEQIREKYPQVPVILMTRSGSEEIAVKALRAGASNYVPKRNLRSHLGPILEQVLFASKIDRCRERMLRCLTERDSRFTLESDPALVSPLVALLQEDLLAMGLCDATGATRVSIALEEALLNSLYHGNLEVGSDLPHLGEDSFRRLIEQRRKHSPYRERRLRIFATITRAEAVYVIFDEGPGFDPSILPDPAASATMDKPRGRGVLLMRTFMDQVSYSAGGRQVTLVKKRERK